MSNNTKSGIRSLVCDANGIIVAEMVYRCMICAEIHEVLDECERHYHHEHMNEDDNNSNSDHKNLNSNNNTLSSKPSNSLIKKEKIDVDEDNYDDLNLLPDGTPMFDDANLLSNSLLTEVPAGNSKISLGNISEKPFKSSHSSQRDQWVVAATNTSLLTKTPAGRKIGGGFVTCEVCGLTKYYSHISRRYGVFSCESCAKFFYRYLLKPSTFTCSSNGNCSLKIDVPGGRCKSCLLKACLQKYVIDPKKHPKIFQKSNDTNVNISQSSSINVKANKPNITTLELIGSSLVPSQQSGQFVKIAMRPESKQAEINLNLDFNDQNLLSNGMVKPSGSASKRKQQFDEQVPKIRRGSCRECPGCLADDCGQCLYCLDKPKFGGQDVKKQRCIRRRCHRS